MFLRGTGYEDTGCIRVAEDMVQHFNEHSGYVDVYKCLD
jgi:hypothetical protein